MKIYFLIPVLALLSSACLYADPLKDDDSIIDYFEGLERKKPADQRTEIGLGEWLAREGAFDDLFENDPMKLKIQRARGLEGGGSADEILRSVVQDETLFQKTWEDELLDLKINRANRLGSSGNHEEAAKSLEGQDLGGVKAHVEVATQYGFIAEAKGVARQEKRDTLELMKKHLDLATHALGNSPSRSKAYWEFKIRDLEQKRRSLLEDSKAVTRNSKPSTGGFEHHFGSKTPNPKPDVVIPKPKPRPRIENPQTLRTSDRTPDNPIFGLRISSPEDIGEAEAKTVFRGMGLMNSRRTFEDALKGMKIGYTYKRKGPHRLDSKMKEWIFKEYRLMKKAMEKYAAYPEVSQRKTPKLYEQWMQKASLHLTAIRSPSERFALLKSLMTQESGKVHWRKFKPTMGSAVDIGFGQFLPATAKSVGINPYDPEENIRGIAIYLNRLIKKSGMRTGLARYNGGYKPPAKSFAYADSIMNRMDELV